MGAGDFREYDPDQVSASVNGVPLSGFADGEMIGVERQGDDFEDVVGTDGEVTRSKSSDNRATVTVRLMQSSPANDLLSAMRTLDKASPNGAGVGPFMLRDKQGRTILLAEKCWIAAPPKSSWDRTAKEREWKIRCASLVEFHGGN